MQSLDKIFKRSPTQQFGIRGDRESSVSLSDRFSPTGVGAGMGQGLKSPSAPESGHLNSLSKHNVHLSMMQFDMNQRRSI